MFTFLIDWLSRFRTAKLIFLVLQLRHQCSVYVEKLDSFDLSISLCGMFGMDSVMGVVGQPANAQPYLVEQRLYNNSTRVSS